MNINKFFQSGVFGIFSVVLLNSATVFAQPIQSISSRYPSTSDLKIHFQPPHSTSNVADNVADNGTPKSENQTGSQATGTRTGNECLATKIPLTPLTGQSSSLALTTSSHPTFFVYVPYTSDDVYYGVFSLYDEQTQQEVWNVIFQLPKQSGIVSIPSPKDKKPLELEKNYRWFFELHCAKNDAINQEPLMVMGEVKRVSSEGFEGELSTASPLEKVAIYAKQGLWYDALGQLATLQQSDPQNSQLQTLWIELLKASKSDKLEPIYQESLVGNIRLEF